MLKEPQRAMQIIIAETEQQRYSSAANNPLKRDEVQTTRLHLTLYILCNAPQMEQEAN